MRLRERDKRTAGIWTFTGMDEDIYTWGTGRKIRAAVYPLGRETDARIYGERIRDMRVMLYDGEGPLEVGMGVYIQEDAPAREDGERTPGAQMRRPNYRIIALERWTHWKATLQRIPEGRSGCARG